MEWIWPVLDVFLLISFLPHSPHLFTHAEILGALLSVFTIWLVTGVLVYLAVERLINSDYTIEGAVMLITSGCAVLANIMWEKYTLSSHLYSFYQHTVCFEYLWLNKKPIRRGRRTKSTFMDSWRSLCCMLSKNFVSQSWLVSCLENTLFLRSKAWPSHFTSPATATVTGVSARTGTATVTRKEKDSDLKPRPLKWWPCRLGAKQGQSWYVSCIQVINLSLSSHKWSVLAMNLWNISCLIPYAQDSVVWHYNPL